VIENMSSFTDHHGDVHALFGTGGGEALAAAIDAPLLGQIPIESAVSAGGDAGEPVAIGGSSAAADVFRGIADTIVTELAPIVAADDIDMAGCTARLFESVDAAFAKLDAQTASTD
jgi:ATP-binding protein involved in chromosome partitioning